jgi:hypothetical protein
MSSDQASTETADNPPFYNTLYLVVVGLCVAGISWLMQSGALVLWDRHPQPGESYELGWWLSLLVALPSGFLIGSYLMFVWLNWYRDRDSNRQ